jgi:hypothetical protein
MVLPAEIIEVVALTYVRYCLVINFFVVACLRVEYVFTAQYVIFIEIVYSFLLPLKS